MPIDRQCSSGTRTDGRCANHCVGSRHGTEKCGNVEVIIEQMDTCALCNDCKSTKEGSYNLMCNTAEDTETNSIDDLSIATPTTLLTTSVVSSPCPLSKTSRWSGDSSREPLLPSTLHTVVYYQNRFVTINGATDCPVTTAPTIRLSQRSQTVLPEVHSIELDMADCNINRQNQLNRRTIVKFGHSVLSTLTRLLQDNRMTSSDLSVRPSKDQERSRPVLHKILNIIFISTGIILLLAVVVVIVYTTVGE